MVTPDLSFAEPRRLSLPVSRLKWGLAATVVLIFGYVGLRIGVPGYQRRGAVRKIELFNGSIQYLHRPAWLFKWLGEDGMLWFDDPDHLVFWPDEANLMRRSRHGGIIPRTTGPLIDDENMTCVLGLPKLKSLDFAFSSVGDAGVKHLSGLRKLENLRLEGSDVSDLSIPILSRMRSLKSLNVEHTKITKSGGHALEAALPGCDVRGPHNDRSERRIW